MWTQFLQIQWWTGFNSPPVHYLLPLFFWLRLILASHPRLVVQGQEYTYTRNAPVVYGTPTESVDVIPQIERWTGLDSPPAHYPMAARSGWHAKVGQAGLEQTNSIQFKFKFKFKVQSSKFKVQSSRIMYVGTSERFQRALSKARQGKEGAYKNVYGYSWGKKDHANADNERLKGKGEPGRTLARARAAMGYVRAVGARVSFDAAADGDGGCGVELRAGAKVKLSSRKMPESSISCSSGSSSFPTANCVGANSSTSASPAQLSQLDVELLRARAYERRDGDAAASPRAAYSGARGVAGSSCWRSAPMHHSHRALRERVRILVYALSVERRHGGGRDERVRAVGAGVAGGVREGAGGGEGGGGGRGGACEASDEQGHSDESGEGGGEPGGAVDALGRSGTGNWKGEPPPPHDEPRRALLELAEHQAHTGGAGGGVQVLHGLFALQGRVARRCAEGERELRGGGVGVEDGGDEGAELGEAEGREAGRQRRRRLGRRGECMAAVEGKDEEGK
ncbi:hypothetical protein B0H14DRAFT_2650811 [Mycena olivaceomarginata]|nr:hypothetical protein B0H14DRAFT_2650811 [Mycena olivaceomarginata]